MIDRALLNDILGADWLQNLIKISLSNAFINFINMCIYVIVNS